MLQLRRRRGEKRCAIFGMVYDLLCSDIESGRLNLEIKQKECKRELRGRAQTANESILT